MPHDAAEERIFDVREGERGAFWGEVKTWALREEQAVLAALLSEQEMPKIFRFQGQLRVLRRIAGLPGELVEQIKEEESN